MGVLIAAAGRSERAGPGEPKPFRAIGGVPMLARAIQPFARHPRVREIVVALPREFVPAPPPWLEGLAAGRLRVVEGGETRALSVRAALRALDSRATVVLVHDAARPFVSDDTLEAVIAKAAGGIGAIAAVPVSDTLKRADADTHRVVETVDRADLWRAHTPQGFPRAMLEEAYRRAPASLERGATDEAALVEAAGYPVELVRDRSSNLKITTPDDFLVAQALTSS